MKFIHSLLLAPTLALCGTFSGTVTLLDGTPVAGAVVTSLTDSVTTTASGTFALARATGIASRSSKTISVTSHLVVENGRPRVTFAGMDISGRVRNSAASRQILSNSNQSLAARSAGTQDTLKVYWKGKRLTVLPVTSDTTVTFRIDTAWKDDAGIPWNPTITYGSLFDSRDGQTYRTIQIPELSDDQTWMAENLNFKTDSSWIFNGVDSTEMTVQGHFPFLVDSMGAKYGRYYQWAAALRLPDSCLATACSTSSQGVCPTGWHIPSMEQWGLGTPAKFVGRRIFLDALFSPRHC